MPTLTAIDLLGIQRFVFGSNRLRDVIGASQLVARACSWDGDSPLRHIPEAHRLMAAGGSALLRFEGLSAAHDFAGKYSRWLHDTAPGLEVVIAHRSYRDGELAAAIRALQIELARVKTERAPSAPLAGLSVTETCNETGLPAVDLGRLGGQQTPVSATTRAARRAWSSARTQSPWGRHLEDLSKETGRSLARPPEIDALGRSHGDTSLVAVVHIDGNGIGSRISDWLRGQSESPDAELWTRFRTLSRALDDLAANAMKRVLTRAAWSLTTEDDDEGRPRTYVQSTIRELAFALQEAHGDADQGDEPGVCMPVWPVLVGGDDLTFVCDGRISLDLTTEALSAFEDTPVAELGVVTASAGVAIVRSHAPFHRAYELAERLCAEAKRKRVERRHTGCMLDWHLGEVRPGEGVGALRERHYEGDRFTARPMPLGDRAMPASGTWRWIDTELLSPDGEQSFRGKLWRERRNKVKVLRERLREGDAAVKQVLEAWKRVDPELRLPDGAHTSRGTSLLDAIELLDVHVPLDPTDRPAGTES
jgi:hypothetical protein